MKRDPKIIDYEAHFAHREQLLTCQRPERSLFLFWAYHECSLAIKMYFSLGKVKYYCWCILRGNKKIELLYVIIITVKLLHCQILLCQASSAVFKVGMVCSTYLLVALSIFITKEWLHLDSNYAHKQIYFWIQIKLEVFPIVVAK